MSRHINGVSKMHVEQLKIGEFKLLNLEFPSKIKAVRSGVSPRRWIHCSNTGLSHLLQKQLAGTSEWLYDLQGIRMFEDVKDDPDFIEDWRQMRQQNKRALVS